MKFKRIVLKLSGTFFSGNEESGLDFTAIAGLAEGIEALHKNGLEIAVVNGAGNIFRGRSKPKEFDQVAADNIGMISTLPNALALTEILNARGIDTRLMSSFEIPGITRQFDAFRARRLLSEGKILLLAGGTGNPYFSTDTCAVLRALEIQADILIKATDVEGIFSEDPHKNPHAEKYETIRYQELLDKQLQIMDQTAFSLARDNKLPIFVCKFTQETFVDTVMQVKPGTLITS